MENPENNKFWTELNGDAMRQLIDTISVFTAWEEARKTFAGFSGGRKATSTAETDHQYAERKDYAKLRLDGLAATLVRHQRMNWALYVGRVPKELINRLNYLLRAGLAGRFSVVEGDWALYAYEAAAGVRLRDDLMPGLDSGEITFRSDLEISQSLKNPLFTSIVISKSGHMARIHAISPLDYVERKRNEAVRSEAAGGLAPEDRERL